MDAKIKVFTVGSAFACAGEVIVRGKRVARTRDFPHGMRSNAYWAAVEIARDRGYRVPEADAAEARD